MKPGSRKGQECKSQSNWVNTDFVCDPLCVRVCVCDTSLSAGSHIKSIFMLLDIHVELMAGLKLIRWQMSTVPNQFVCCSSLVLMAVVS